MLRLSKYAFLIPFFFENHSFKSFWATFLSSSKRSNAHRIANPAYVGRDSCVDSKRVGTCASDSKANNAREIRVITIEGSSRIALTCVNSSTIKSGAEVLLRLQLYDFFYIRMLVLELTLMPKSMYSR